MFSASADSQNPSFCHTLLFLHCFARQESHTLSLSSTTINDFHSLGFSYCSSSLSLSVTISLCRFHFLGFNVVDSGFNIWRNLYISFPSSWLPQLQVSTVFLIYVYKYIYVYVWCVCPLCFLLAFKV